ncbi:hypothetical protein JKP88DRAFT_235617 [Tribonema minus]|uniref:Uncharacterized protein n=1 Tax=Tribonema minus TaxID=303371 RepID=A0A835Z5V8_9STRA|nr:hypothetical protein JKP88DRAFT_235617 [Tribonema minus]
MACSMQILLLAVCLALASFQAAAFTGPVSALRAAAVTKASCRRSAALRMAQEQETETEETEGEGKSKVKKGPTWMYNKNGVAYAPWMVDTFDPENIAKVEAAMEARRLAKLNTVAESVGDLARDPQAMELSGLGLNIKQVNGNDVELEWKTGDEAGNLGFVVSKRRGKTDEWTQIASYKDWAPLNSKGEQGGRYTFVDPDCEQGTWVYRVSDVNSNGSRNDLCQALIEVQSASDALQAKAAVALFGVVVVAAIASAFLIDPLQ